jgi:hypothetical protein
MNGSLKVDKWCALAHKRVIGPIFNEEDIITSDLLLGMLENYPLPQFNSSSSSSSKLILTWMLHVTILLTTAMMVSMCFPG